MNAIVLTCQATVGAGDSALVLSPLWPNTAAAIRVTGAEPIEVPFLEDDQGFQLDWDRLEGAVRSNTKLLALASPSNPTGWTASHEDWKRLVEFAERHRLWLLADAVYERIVFAGRVAPGPLAVPGAMERTFLAQSFSKAYRMTGWRIGYVVAPPALGPTLAYLQEFAVSHAAGIQQEAARVAMLEGEDFLFQGQARYSLHRRLAVDRLRRINGLKLVVPYGAFYVFPRLDGLTDSMDFCEYLVREWRLGVAPGVAFGEGGEGHVRICFAVDEHLLMKALDVFEAGWESYRAKL
jgi:aspartate/methionine/tyrosine aminotransferase